MIKVVVNSQSCLLSVEGSHDERKASAHAIRDIIHPRDREYIPYQTWKIRNPFKYAEKIPALASALDDSQRQFSLLSAKDVAMTQDQKYAEFFFYLTVEEQLIILECAYQGLVDELMDGNMREHGQLDDMKDEYLEPIKDKLEQFMNGAD